MTPDARAQQVELYGATVGDSVDRVREVLGLSQAAVSRILGVSAPMLSQLVHGQRIKFGNQLAVQRLQSLLDLVEEVGAGLAHESVAARLEEIASERSSALTRPRHDPSALAASGPALVGAVLRAVASGRQLTLAAEALWRTSPDLAQALLVYGTGSPEEARRHFDSIAHLVR